MNASALFALAALVLAAYVRSLWGDLLRDDVPAIVKNEDVRPEARWTQAFENDFWGTPIAHNHSHKSYRPLAALTFRLNYVLHGEWAPGYHAVNICVHFACCLLLQRIARGFQASSRSAKWAALLFAVHPANSEAVISVVGRADVLGGMGFLLALWFWQQSVRGLLPLSGEPCGSRLRAGATEQSGATGLRGWSLSSSWAWLLSAWAVLTVTLLVKEVAVMGLAVLVALDGFLGLACLPRAGCPPGRGGSGGKMAVRPGVARRALACLALRAVGTLAVAMALMAFSQWVRGPMFGPKFSVDTNPVPYAPTVATRGRTYALIHALYARVLLAPLQLSAEYAMNQIPLVESWQDGRLVAAAAWHLLLAYAAGMALVPRSPLARAAFSAGRARRVGDDGARDAPEAVLLDRGGVVQLALWAALLLLVAPLVPALGVLVPVGTVLAERLLYVPCAGLCLVLALGLDLALPSGGVAEGESGSPPASAASETAAARTAAPSRGRPRARPRCPRWASIAGWMAVTLLAARCAVRCEDWQDIDALLFSTLRYRNQSIASYLGLAQGQLEHHLARVEEIQRTCRSSGAAAGGASGGGGGGGDDALCPEAHEYAAAHLVWAKDLLGRALSIYPGYGTAVIEFARILLAEGKEDAGMRLLERAGNMSSPRRFRSFGLRLLARLHMDRGQLGRACYALEVASRLQPQEKDGLTMLSHCYYERHQRAVSPDREAEEAARAPDAREAWRVGIEHRHVQVPRPGQRGPTELSVLAVAAMRRAAELDPSDATVLRNLAVMMATTAPGGALVAAPEDLLHASGEDERTAEGSRSRAHGVVFRGNSEALEEPLRLLEMAMQLDPSDPATRSNHAQIARVYRRQRARERGGAVGKSTEGSA